MCNAREKLYISIILYWYDDKKNLRLYWSEKNAYKIGLILIISWYAGKVLFSGVFYISSIFQDGGMVMDEAGRNGWKWHLAQQITEPVILYRLQQSTSLHIVTIHTTCNQTTYHAIINNNIQATNHTPCNHAHSVDNNKLHIL